ncbi:MAG: DUF2975 domain-containing protein [Ruminococcaceae bacterium]|jgi:uncharacterized membrane protein|nr:DUF2975 domain-containing protein [Oscillospiraceae bacterium]
MNNKSVKTLKVLLIIVLAAVFIFEALILYPLSIKYAYRVQSFSPLRTAFIVFVYATSVLFYIAVFQGLRICNKIIENKPFSKSNIYNFRIARNCAAPVVVLYLVASVFIYVFTANHGTPAITAVVASALVSFTALILTLACSVLIEMLKRAHELQEENAMTI